jgi:ankyrin repeat protein
MLNPLFAQADWRPDPFAVYQCSPVTDATGFTYVMTLVMSGRDKLTGRLARQAELEAFLRTPEAAHACTQTNSKGWTALMLAVRNSRTDSTEVTVALLLAHESSGTAARMQEKHGYTALMLAARYSNMGSSEATVTMLLAHESARDTAPISLDGATALRFAVLNAKKYSSEGTVAMLLDHESSSQALRMVNRIGESLLVEAARKASEVSTESTVAMLVPHVDAADFQNAVCLYPGGFRTYLLRLHEGAQERAILSTALRQGLSLAEATTLLYL